MCAGAAELFSSFVHHVGKIGNRASDMFAESVSHIIGGFDEHDVERLLHSEFLILFQTCRSIAVLDA